MSVRAPSTVTEQAPRIDSSADTLQQRCPVRDPRPNRGIFSLIVLLFVGHACSGGYGPQPTGSAGSSGPGVGGRSGAGGNGGAAGLGMETAGSGGNAGGAAGA